MIIQRTKPVNIKNEDLWIFKHELEKTFNDPQILDLKNVVLNGELHFEKRTNYPLLLSYNNKTFETSIWEKIKKIIKFQFCIKLRKHFIITDDWSNGYFHWLMDCLPRLMLFGEKRTKLSLILPAHLKDEEYVSESLHLLGIKNFRFLRGNNWYYFKSLSFPVHLAETGNYNDEIMKILRNNLVTKPIEPSGLKIYISRSKASRRKIINEEQILPLLSRMGFKTIYCEDLSFQEQVNLFSKVKYLVSNHGAGLSNMLFMPPGASILELRKINDNHNNCYFSLASSVNLKYYYLQCLPLDEQEESHTANIEVNVKEFEDEIIKMIHEES
jgi:capsular polysaccharide biosynthesis protein